MFRFIKKNFHTEFYFEAYFYQIVKRINHISIHRLTYKRNYVYTDKFTDLKRFSSTDY